MEFGNDCGERRLQQASDRKGAGLRGERKALPTVWEEVPERG